MILESIFVLFGVWRLPGPPLDRSGVPFGATVFPRGAPGAKSWFIAPPLAAQNEVIFGLFLQICRVKMHQKTYSFFDGCLGGF